jgi:hypothetical protein
MLSSDAAEKGEIILNPGANYIKHFWRYLRGSQNLMIRANIVIKKDKMFDGIGCCFRVAKSSYSNDSEQRTRSLHHLIYNNENYFDL